MSPGRQRSRLDPCPVTCSTTATSRTSAAWCSPPSKATTAHFAVSATPASCASKGRAIHAIWWTVDATTAEEALALLPFYVAERTTATSVSDVEIP